MSLLYYSTFPFASLPMPSAWAQYVAGVFHHKFDVKAGDAFYTRLRLRRKFVRGVAQ